MDASGAAIVHCVELELCHRAHWCSEILYAELVVGHFDRLDRPGLAFRVGFIYLILNYLRECSQRIQPNGTQAAFQGIHETPRRHQGDSPGEEDSEPGHADVEQAGEEIADRFVAFPWLRSIS